MNTKRLTLTEIGEISPTYPTTAMKIWTLFSIATLGIAGTGFGQYSTDPVGLVNVTVRRNSDATIAVPMNRSPEYKGTISAISGNSITLNGAPGWANGQFVPLATDNKTYAVQFASGVKEGMIGKITGNTQNSITVELDAGDNLSGIVVGASGDFVDIFPYWTPATLFSSVPPVGFELSGFEGAGAGTNVGASEIYVHIGGNVWEDGVNGGEDPHRPLRFGGGFVARNNSGADYTAAFVGSVPMNTSRIRLVTKAGGVAQDQYIGYMSPVPEAIATVSNPNALGFPVSVGDTIQGFDNSVLGINKGADEIFVWTGTEWEDGVNGGSVTPGVQSLKPGFGYIYQKAATVNPTSVVWSRVPSYLQ